MAGLLVTGLLILCALSHYIPGGAYGGAKRKYYEMPFDNPFRFFYDHFGNAGNVRVASTAAPAKAAPPAPVTFCNDGEEQETMEIRSFYTRLCQGITADEGERQFQCLQSNNLCTKSAMSECSKVVNRDFGSQDYMRSMCSGNADDYTQMQCQVNRVDERVNYDVTPYDVKKNIHIGCLQQEFPDMYPAQTFPQNG